jgi:hypothetical protein
MTKSIFEKNNINTRQAIDIVKKYLKSGVEDQKNQPNGIAGLDENGKLPLSLFIDGFFIRQSTTWDALNNIPDLFTIEKKTGFAWFVGVSGFTNLSGVNDWQVGDIVVYIGDNNFAKIDNTDNTSLQKTANLSDLTNNATARTNLDVYSITQTDNALNLKVDKVAGKGLSTNDFDNNYKAQLDNFNENSQDAVGSILTDTDRIDFSYNDELNKITADIKTNSIDNSFISNTADISTSKLKQSLISPLNEIFTNNDTQDVINNKTQGQLNDKAPKIDGEPNGFIDTNQISLSWNEATRTLTIAKVGDSFSFYSNGVKYTKTANESITISNDIGNHFVYFDNNGLLQETTTFTSELILRRCYVAFIYWTGTASLPDAQIETHGCEWASEIHLQQHLTIGTKYESGLALSVIADADGSNDDHIRLAGASGIIWDEDIKHNISSHLLTDTLPIIYRVGVNDWNVDKTGNFITKKGTNRAYYNQNVGGNYQLTELTNNNLAVAYVYVAPSITYKWFIVMGQEEYNNINSARDGARNAPNLGNLPLQEFKLIGAVIYQTSDSYSNNAKARIISIDGVAPYVDWRQSIATANNADILSSDIVYLQNQIDNKVDKITGKSLSTNDFDNSYKTKLDGIEIGATKQIQADYSQTDNTKLDFIKNKPTNKNTKAWYISGGINGSGNNANDGFTPNSAFSTLAYANTKLGNTGEVLIHLPSQLTESADFSQYNIEITGYNASHRGLCGSTGTYTSKNNDVGSQTYSYLSLGSFVKTAPVSGSAGYVKLLDVNITTSYSDSSNATTDNFNLVFNATTPISITGSGIKNFYNQRGGVFAVNNASASVNVVTDDYISQFTLTAGLLSIRNAIIYVASGTTFTIGASGATFIAENVRFLYPDNTIAKINIPSGVNYSLQNNCIYDNVNSTLNGTNISSLYTGYFDSIISNSVGLKSATANTILGTNANKQIQSLSVATYPNLTELSYVKGVTSALQTQLNGKLSTTLKGAVNGLAELDATGKVPSSQLPAFVDDVLEYANLSSFPVTGESGKIYIAVDTNLQYRWSGTQYVIISASLALGETSSTAYRGDRGKIAYDHSQILSGNPHNTTKADIGLANVDNTSDANKNVLSATKLTTARAINGVSFDGTANITIEDNTKEPAFTKNTAFNKNFGNTAGTITEGNDARLGTKAVDETNIGNDKIQVYNSTTGKLEYQNKPIGATNLSIVNKTSTTLDIASDTGTDATIPQVTTTEAGLMTSVDKVKINNLTGINTGDETSDTIYNKIQMRILAGDNITLLKNDIEKTITFSSTGGGGGGSSDAPIGTIRGFLNDFTPASSQWIAPGNTYNSTSYPIMANIYAGRQLQPVYEGPLNVNMYDGGSLETLVAPDILYAENPESGVLLYAKWSYYGATAVILKPNALGTDLEVVSYDDINAKIGASVVGTYNQISLAFVKYNDVPHFILAGTLDGNATTWRISEADLLSGGTWTRGGNIFSNRSPVIVSNNNDVLLAVAYYGFSNTLWRSVNAGISWSSVTLPNSATSYGSCTGYIDKPVWNGSVFFIYFKGQTGSATSADGLSWVSRSLNLQNTFDFNGTSSIVNTYKWYTSCFVGGRDWKNIYLTIHPDSYCNGSYYYGYSLYSNDNGVTFRWCQNYGRPGVVWTGEAFLSSAYSSGSTSSYYQYAYSTDHNSWTAITIPQAYNGGNFGFIVSRKFKKAFWGNNKATITVTLNSTFNLPSITNSFGSNVNLRVRAG